MKTITPSTPLNSASAPTGSGGASVHLHIRRGDVPPYAILPGDPARTLLIAGGWDSATEVAYNREFKTVTGICQGTPIGCTSTGVGAASSEVCIHELRSAGVHTCVRVGTTGCIQPGIELGDLIIPTACVRKDGTSDKYIGAEYPAAADIYVVMALMQACESLGYRYHLGIGYTTASFYIGQGRPIAERQGENGTGSTHSIAAEEQAAGGNPQSGYWPSFADNIIPDLRSAGVTNIEMEAAGQFVVGRLHGMRMGAVLAVIANRITDEWGDKGGEEKSAKAATEAIRILSEWDRARKVEFTGRMP